MNPLVSGVIVLLLGLAVVIWRVRPLFQSMAKGADKAARQLGGNWLKDGSMTQVEIWDCRPMTIPMIISLAESRGYTFVKASSSRRNGARTLRFRPPERESRSLSLDL